MNFDECRMMNPGGQHDFTGQKHRFMSSHNPSHSSGQGLRFTPQTLQDIRGRISLMELVRQVTPLKRKGRSWWGCCPFHQEKTASFHVVDEEGFYHCFGCGAHGNAFDFVQQTRGLSFPDAVEYLAGQAGVTLERRTVDPAQQKRRQDGFAVLERASAWFTRNLGAGVTTPQARYLRGKRGLTDDTISAFALGYAPDGWRELKSYLQNEGFGLELAREAGLVKQSDKGGEDYDVFRHRVMFPIFDTQGRPVAFGGRVLDGGEPKYLNSPETPFFSKSRTLYGLYHNAAEMRKLGQALLVEGYMDVVALWQHGIRTAVAPLGTAVTEEQIDLLWRYVDTPTICLDGDAAGQAAARRTAWRALKVIRPGVGLRFVTLPGGEDPDSLVQKHGKKAFAELLANPLTLEDVLWAELTESRDLQSAEGRAAVDAAIGELSRAVENPTMRRHLQRALNDRLWQAVRGSSTTRRKVAGHTQPGAGRAHLDLLALVLENPAVLPRIEQAFAALKFEDDTERALHKAIVQAFLKKPAAQGLETDWLGDYLNHAGMLASARTLAARSSIQRKMRDKGVLLSDVEGCVDFWFAIHGEIENAQYKKRMAKTILEEIDDDGNAAITTDPQAWRRFMAARGVKPVKS